MSLKLHIFAICRLRSTPSHLHYIGYISRLSPYLLILDILLIYFTVYSILGSKLILYPWIFSFFFSFFLSHRQNLRITDQVVF